MDTLPNIVYETIQGDLLQIVKNYYPDIKKLVLSKAYNTRLDYEELLGQVHYKISTAIVNDRFTSDQKLIFFKWMNLVINNCALDMLRTKKRIPTDLVSINDDMCPPETFENLKTYQFDDSTKNLLKEILDWIKIKYSSEEKQHWLIMFKMFFIQDKSYKEIAKKLDISINTVSGAIRYIRKDISTQFILKYKEEIITT